MTIDSLIKALNEKGSLDKSLLFNIDVINFCNSVNEYGVDDILTKYTYDEIYLYLLVKTDKFNYKKLISEKERKLITYLYVHHYKFIFIDLAKLLLSTKVLNKYSTAVIENTIEFLINESIKANHPQGINYLGKFYYHIKNDLEGAKKIFSLNKKDDVAKFYLILIEINQSDKLVDCSELKQKLPKSIAKKYIHLLQEEIMKNIIKYTEPLIFAREYDGVSLEEEKEKFNRSDLLDNAFINSLNKSEFLTLISILYSKKEYSLTNLIIAKRIELYKQNFSQLKDLSGLGFDLSTLRLYRLHYLSKKEALEKLKAEKTKEIIEKLDPDNNRIYHLIDSDWLIKNLLEEDEDDDEDE